MKAPQELWLQARIEEILPGSFDRLEMLAEMPREAAAHIVDELLEFACLSQSMGAMNGGRRALARIPPAVLGPLIDSQVHQVVNVSDEYEFRRLMEALEIACPDKISAYAELGRQSSNADVSLAAQEYE